jgi:hypothetical protein
MLETVLAVGGTRGVAGDAGLRCDAPGLRGRVRCSGALDVMPLATAVAIFEVGQRHHERRVVERVAGSRIRVSAMV